MKHGKFQKKRSFKLPIITVLLCCTVAGGVWIAGAHLSEGESIRAADGTHGESSKLIGADTTVQNALGKAEVSMGETVPGMFTLSEARFTGSYSSTVTKKSGSRSASTVLTLDRDLIGKPLYEETFKLDNGKTREISAYFTRVRDSASLNIDVKDSEEEWNTKSWGVSAMFPSTREKFYCLTDEDTLILVDKREKTDGWYDGYFYLSYDPSTDHTDLSLYWNYEENITVYHLGDEVDKVLEIKRQQSNRPTEFCDIYYGDDHWTYASGYGSVNTDAQLISTEQEFCDKANSLLSQYTEAINVTRTSWDNRWYRLEVDESVVSKSGLKVDAACTYGVQEGDSVSGEIEILVNAMEIPHGSLEEEAPDQVIDYHPTEAPPVIPSNLPSNIDSEWLEKVEDFYLDGFWYSLDGRYVYHIYGTEYTANSVFGNTVHYVDLNGSDKVKAGKVVQTSGYSVILKANEDSGFKPEVFTADGMLMGEEVNLYRTDIIRASWLLGTWKNDDVTYEFSEDGIYHVDGERRSYWGYYFLIGKDQIVLSEQNEDCELMEYTLDGNTLVLDGSITLRR